MARKETKTSPDPKKASAKRAMDDEEASAFDLTPVETIRLSPEDASSKFAEVLRMFMQAYEDL